MPLTAVAPLDPELAEYLRRAAKHRGQGILIGKDGRAVAELAIAAGYGRATDGWFPLFVVNERGRAAVAASGVARGVQRGGLDWVALAGHAALYAGSIAVAPLGGRDYGRRAKSPLAQGAEEARRSSARISWRAK